jgi:hypothetical protein
VAVVAAGKRRGRKPRAPATDIHALTGLTYNELRALLCELDADAAQLPRPPLVLRLRRLIIQLIVQQYVWSPKYIEHLRWFFVYQGRLLGPELGWGELCFACEVLKGTQAEADTEQMSKVFWHHCPPENAHPRKRKPKIKNDEACSFDRAFMVRATREFCLKKIPGWPIDDYDVDVLPHWVISFVNYPTLF